MSDADPWDEYAETWDDDPAARAYSVAAYDSLVDILHRFDRRLDSMIVCDFGCGTGLLTERLADRVATIDAVDTSAAMIDQLTTKAETRRWTHVRPARAIPEHTATHDLVVCSSVLAFVDDYPKTTTRLVGLLRPGGVFVQWDWELDPTDDEPYGLTRADMVATLDAAGLVDVTVETAFELPFEDMIMQPLIGYGRVG